MSTNKQPPSVGRMVHFDRAELGLTTCLSATIAGVVGDPADGIVNLGSILDEFGDDLVAEQEVPMGENGTGKASWHWPEYVGPGA